MARMLGYLGMKTGPTYDGKYLRSRTNELLGDQVSFIGDRIPNPF